MLSSSQADRRQSVAPTVGLALAAAESRRTERPMRAALAMREREQQMQDAGAQEQADGAEDGRGVGASLLHALVDAEMRMLTCPCPW